MKRFSIIILVFLLNCSFQSGAADEISLARGGELLKRGNYKEAISVFTALVGRNPNDAEANAGLVRAQVETGDYGGAEKRAKEYLAARPDAVALKVALGEIELETGRFAEAASDFERAARDAKGALWLRASMGRARALIRAGKRG